MCPTEPLQDCLHFYIRAKICGSTELMLSSLATVDVHPGPFMPLTARTSSFVQDLEQTLQKAGYRLHHQLPPLRAHAAKSSHFFLSRDLSKHFKRLLSRLHH
ncbi:hypothetical protein AVEN_217775-1 [Araneus ventricosus]|uniref:Uncharacterized protein n=1 Tax=Araneus ventricosus TaxID=182803 RepID=A0A4Y2TTY9_ARAVE|nr:hypothetical protein AVEN_217775-1 [Araneus ventricosus]